jgi:hypothetical protein
LENKNQISNIKYQKYGVHLRWTTSLFFIFNLLFLIFFFGCVSQQKVDKQICPPITSVEQASTNLGDYYAGIRPVKAVGSCVLKYRGQGNKPAMMSFPVRLWFENNEKFCIYGDMFFDPKGLGFAMSGEDFWAYAKSMGFYIEGKKDKPIDKKIGAFFCPTVIFDFLNPLDAAGVKALLISSSNAIRCADSKNHRVKKIYLGQCDKFVRKVEYLDRIGRASIVAELDDYKKVADGNFYFPHRLIYKHCKGRKCSDSMEIKFDSVNLWQPSVQQIEALFSKPDTSSLNKNDERDKVK